MIVIDAVYIHESGGKTLLEYFISGLLEKHKDFCLLLDKRLRSQVADKANGSEVYYLEPSEKERNKFYRQNEQRITTVFCFANVPPANLNSSITVWILFHNSLILSGLLDQNSYSLKAKALFLARRIYIRYRNKKRYKWIVQTTGMKKKLMEKLGLRADAVMIMPFFENDFLHVNKDRRLGLPGFLYVADGVKQKNHQVLLEAWKILYKHYDLTPELHLTVPDRFGKLLEQIKECKKLGLRIYNHGICNKIQLRKLYSENSFLIFPSLTESFGLPLVEAATAGCMILASDLPYVYDVIKPTAVFDASDAASIANVVASVTTSETIEKTEIVITDHRDQIIHLIYNN